MNGCNDSAYLNKLKPNIYINIFDIFYIGRTATRMMGWKLKVSVLWHLRVSLYADANNGGWRVEGTTRYVKPQVWVLFVHLIATRSFFKIVAVQILAWCCWMPAGATITTHQTDNSMSFPFWWDMVIETKPWTVVQQQPKFTQKLHRTGQVMGAFFGLSQAGDELTATRELKGSNRARNRHSVSVCGGCFGRCLARPEICACTVFTI